MTNWSELPLDIRRAIDAYAKAKIHHSWKGGKDPADWPEIEKRVEATRNRLAKLLTEIIQRT